MFVRAFPMIKRVSFSYCEWERNWLAPTTCVFRELPQPPVKTVICLEHVGIHDSVSQAILEVLLQRDTFKLDLKGANIYWDTLENFPMYEEFFHVVGTNLQTLELRVCVWGRHEPDAIIQLLSKCRQLSSFSINISGFQRRCFVLFESILETVTVSSLKEFTIHCTLDSALERKRFIPWEKVDDTLSDAARLPVFRQFTVVVYHAGFGLSVDPSSLDAVHNNLSESMPRLLQAGMLRVLIGAAS
ncbi:hypothetical protein BDZ89DRAFT_1067510 [Hymenopellis radicata]|nr:hypothetical protein BDZ89DRAFT_1067510 [Hymenopellis radicata]